MEMPPLRTRFVYLGGFVAAAAALWMPLRQPEYRRMAIFFAVLWTVGLLVPLALDAILRLSPSHFPQVLQGFIIGAPQVLYFVHAIFLDPPRGPQSLLARFAEPIASVGTWSALAILFGYVTRRITNTLLLVTTALMFIVAGIVGIYGFVRVIGGTMEFESI
jgi:hypothetical protein